MAILKLPKKALKWSPTNSVKGSKKYIIQVSKTLGLVGRIKQFGGEKWKLWGWGAWRER